MTTEAQRHRGTEEDRRRGSERLILCASVVKKAGGFETRPYNQRRRYQANI